MATQLQHAGAPKAPKAGTRAPQQAAQLGGLKAGTRAAEQVAQLGGPKAGTRASQHTASQHAVQQAEQALQPGAPKAGTRAAQHAAAQHAAAQQAAQQEELVKHYIAKIHYSDRYSDDHFEYRHVILPKQLFKMLPKEYFKPDDSGTLRLLEDEEWRGIGIQQSLGWEHYEVHAPEPHVLLFRRSCEPPEPEPEPEPEPLKPPTRFGRK